MKKGINLKSAVDSAKVCLAGDISLDAISNKARSSQRGKKTWNGNSYLLTLQLIFWVRSPLRKRGEFDVLTEEWG